MGHQTKIGLEGELECARQLKARGWDVTLLNDLRVNNPNSDFLIRKDHVLHSVQVKTSRKPKGYITGGSVNPQITAGAPILNRVSAPVCDFVIFLATENQCWRFFIVPISDAERIFRRNIEAYWGSSRLDGQPKKQSGQTDIFVGRTAFPHSRIVPDQRDEVLPYEDRWELL